MPDSEKVFRGLMACTEWGLTQVDCRARGCPYLIEGDTEALFCIRDLHRDAGALIHNVVGKAPVRHEQNWVCGSCGERITIHDRFCARCGREVKWNATD